MNFDIYEAEQHTSPYKTTLHSINDHSRFYAEKCIKDFYANRREKLNPTKSFTPLFEPKLNT